MAEKKVGSGQDLGLWRYPGGDAAPMKIHFKPDGKLVFDGGFQYFNPATWSYDLEKKDLVLKIPQLKPADEESLRDSLRQGSIASYDFASRTIHYTMTDEVNKIEFLGWYFFREMPETPADPQP